MLKVRPAATPKTAESRHAALITNRVQDKKLERLSGVWTMHVFPIRVSTVTCVYRAILREAVPHDKATLVHQIVRLCLPFASPRWAGY